MRSAIGIADVVCCAQAMVVLSKEIAKAIWNDFLDINTPV